MTLRKLLMILVALSFMAQMNAALALDMPWSDAAKYRTECRRSCVEDSFGKGRADEIGMRCSAKCNHLPTSPREQWAEYDKCAARRTDYLEFQNKNAALLEICERALQDRLEACRKKYQPKSNSKPKTEYVPGQFADEYVRQRNHEECNTSVRQSQSEECRTVRVDSYTKELLGRGECVKPSNSRPR